MPKITRRGGPTIASTYPVGILRSPQAEVVYVEGETTTRPRRNANKHAWVAYGESVGFKVDGLTKKQIIGLIGHRALGDH